MATRSLIGMENPDGSIEAIYCHWDGYPEYVGVILAMFYNYAEAKKLMKYGNRSSLKPVPSKKESYAAKGESLKSIQAASFSDLVASDLWGAEFMYIYKVQEKKLGKKIVRGGDWVTYKIDEGVTSLGSISRVKVEFEKEAA